MSYEPEVSVIIPTYNRKNFIERAVKSVLKQTFKNFELVIIDDGSTDGTEEIIKKFKDKRIRYIWQENKGPAGARNRGILEARAKYIAFLDSDDKWRRKKLEIQLNEMKKNPEILLSHTDELWFKNGKVVNPKKKHLKHNGDIFWQSVQLCAISMSTVMVQKRLFDIVGLFDENLLVCEDYDMWLRVTARFPVLLIPERLTVKYAGHPDQMSQKFKGMDRFRIYSLVKILNSGILNKEKFSLALKELERKCQIYGKGCIKHGKIEEGEYYLSLPLKFK